MYDARRHHRRSVRLVGRNYADPGMYFVTICAAGHRCLFGRIDGEDMRLNEWGKVAEEHWRAIPTHFVNVELDVFVVMPNHLHGIIMIADAVVAVNVGATHASPSPPNGPKPRSLATIVGSYKSAVSKRISGIRGTPHAAI